MVAASELAASFYVISASVRGRGAIGRCVRRLLWRCGKTFGSEVHTHDMIKVALKDKIVAVPRLKGNCFIPCRIDDFSELNSKNEYGILEPENYDKEIDKVDLVIVPCVAFDKKCHRIGYGKGCYDVFLEGMDIKRIGLAFDMQVVDAIPAEGHDIKLDKVITEKRIIKLGY